MNNAKNKPYRKPAAKRVFQTPVGVNKPTFGASLLGPLNAALAAKGEQLLDPGVPGLEYEHPLFGRLLVRAENFSVDEITETNEGVFGAVKFEGKPRELRVTIIPEANSGLRVVEAWGGENQPVQFRKRGKSIDLDVPVVWKGHGHNEVVPSARWKHHDNVDVIFLASNGSFLQLQVSISVRSGKVWLLVQEQYRGQIVRTLLSKAKDIGKPVGGGKACLVIPMTSEHAGPHGDYLRNFPNAERFFRLAVQIKAFQALGESKPATWSPMWPETRKLENGMETGVVSFFNGVVGFGQLVTRNKKGEAEFVFVRFPAIMSEDGRWVVNLGRFPYLERGQQVAFRRKKNERGNWEATVVKVL